MKYSIHLYILILFMLGLIIPFPSQLSAQEATDASDVAEEEVSEDKTKKIQDLKERLATKVAEMKTTQTRAMYGTIKAITISSITLETDQKEVKLEVTDDIVVAQNIKGNRTELSIDDLDEGDFVVVFGQYDTALDILDATFIFIQSKPSQYVTGTITSVSKEDYTVTIQTPDDQEVILDYEKSTSTRVYNEDEEFERGGFSSLIEEDTIHVYGTPDPDEKSRIDADKLIIIGNITKLLNTNSATETYDESKEEESDGTDSAVDTEEEATEEE